MSKKIWRGLGIALLILSGSGLPSAADAHHSFAMFDSGKLVTLQGVVRKVEWTNPHVYVYIDVRKGNETKQYSLESHSPSVLTRMGLKFKSIKMGDAITVSINPLRNGQLGGAINSIKTADGQLIKLI